MNRRIVLGLLAAIAAQTLLGYLFSLSPISTILQMASVSFLGAVIGSFVANRNFLIPATILWFLTWLFMFYILFNASNGQASLYSLLEFNSVAMIVSLLATTLGCIAFNMHIIKKKRMATI